jgi:hypothetical protein
MDEDKPRKRDTQLTGFASAKRFLARRTVHVGGARPHPPHSALQGNADSGLSL